MKTVYNMNINFHNKTILITGATGNLGQSMLNFFLNYKCKIIATTTKMSKIKKKKSNIEYLYLNFNDESSISAFSEKIKKYKKIDILINNSGINKIDSIDEIKLKDWESIQRVNLTGSFIITKLVSKIMRKKRKGRILNISSIWGVVGKERRSSYSSSKWGLIGLTKSSSLDLAKDQILVNSISPGIINSDLTTRILGNKGITQIKKTIPIGRLAKKNEIVNCIAFLVSDYNTYITGQNITIDGGYTCG